MSELSSAELKEYIASGKVSVTLTPHEWAVVVVGLRLVASQEAGFIEHLVTRAVMEGDNA